MKAVRSRFGTIVAALALLGGLALVRISDGRASSPPASTVAPSVAPSPAGPESPPASDLSFPGDLPARHREQIALVVRAMDATGRPPDGVVQGGRRGGARGVFQNAEGRLPRRPAGYWVESDVWPRRGARDAERLIFGRASEVYWTRDHYRTFLRLR